MPRAGVRDAAVPLQRGHLATGDGIPHAHQGPAETLVPAEIMSLGTG